MEIAFHWCEVYMCTQPNVGTTQVSDSDLFYGWGGGGGGSDMTKCKGHPIEVLCCGDIIGYYCALFLGHSVFDTLYLVYPSTLINECSIK